ncbi:hypothetical protein ACFHW2_07745 [Actinomadura sp. LOL_016]|uniref:hypothetical protein n=1 Tax=unclassified Actinomadura TaxID=2626254 RepID=UPI003A7FD44F
MRKISRVALPLLGAGALVLGGATAAGATTIESGGAPFSGTVVGTNLSNVTLTGVSSLGLIQTTCTTAELQASVDSDGTNGSLDAADMPTAGNPDCTNNKGGTTQIDALNLPYTGGGAVYDSAHTANRDGYIFINSPNPNVDIVATLDLTSLNRVETCHYGLTGSSQLQINLYNHNNPNKPVAGNAHSQGRLAGQQVQLVSGTSGCPSSASVTATFQIVTASGADVTIAP